MIIRTATAEDWPRIFPVFAAVVAEGRTYAYPEGLSSEQARALWVEPPPATTVVAVDGDALLGTAKAGPNRPGRGAHVATASFMVADAARGRGVGRALGEHVLAWAGAQGFRGMQFNAVVETNTAAVRLWRSLGFELVGTVPEAFDHPEHGLVGLHVMHRRLPLREGPTSGACTRSRPGARAVRSPARRLTGAAYGRLVPVIGARTRACQQHRSPGRDPDAPPPRPEHQDGAGGRAVRT